MGRLSPWDRLEAKIDEYGTEALLGDAIGLSQSYISKLRHGGVPEKTSTRKKLEAIGIKVTDWSEFKPPKNRPRRSRGSARARQAKGAEG